MPLVLASVQNSVMFYRSILHDIGMNEYVKCISQIYIHVSDLNTCKYTKHLTQSAQYITSEPFMTTSSTCKSYSTWDIKSPEFDSWDFD